MKIKGNMRNLFITLSRFSGKCGLSVYAWGHIIVGIAKQESFFMHTYNVQKVVCFFSFKDGADLRMDSFSCDMVIYHTIVWYSAQQFGAY